MTGEDRSGTGRPEGSAERIAARARRIARIRRGAVAGTLSAFVLAWGVIASTGSMGAEATATASAAATTAETTTSDSTTSTEDSTASSGDSTASSDSSSDSTASSDDAVTTAQS